MRGKAVADPRAELRGHQVSGGREPPRSAAGQACAPFSCGSSAPQGRQLCARVPPVVTRHRCGLRPGSRAPQAPDPEGPADAHGGQLSAVHEAVNGHLRQEHDRGDLGHGQERERSSRSRLLDHRAHSPSGVLSWAAWPSGADPSGRPRLRAGIRRRRRSRSFSWELDCTTGLRPCRSVERQPVVRVCVVHPARGDVEQLLAVPGWGRAGRRGRGPRVRRSG
jgi:hypothetical protein